MQFELYLLLPGREEKYIHEFRKECVYLPACGGGCGVVSYNETNSYHSKGCFKVKGVLEKQVLRYFKGKI